MNNKKPLIAKDGKNCPMCEYYATEEVSMMGLKKGWYKEDDFSKRGGLEPCNHVIPEGWSDVLSSDIRDLETKLKELKKQKRLTDRAIQARTEEARGK